MLAQGEIAVDAQDGAPNHLVDHRMTALQIGVRPVDVEVRAVPVRIKAIIGRGCRAVGVERVLDRRAVGGGEERVADGNSPGAVHLARGAEERGAVARLSDQVRRV